MKPLYPFANQVGSLATKTVKTGAHGLGTMMFGFRKGNVNAVPSEGCCSNPSSLSTGWSNPDSSLTAAVNDVKRPLSFKVQNFAVGNNLRSKRIHNLNNILFQNKFRFDPKCVGDSRENQAEDNFEGHLQSASGNQVTICCKEKNQHKGNASPDKVASGPKGFIHSPIIAGDGR